MKKIFIFNFLLMFFTFSLFAGENDIIINNTKHNYEDSIKITNNTTSIINLEIYVQRKSNTKENCIGKAIVPPMKNSFTAKISVEDELDDYDYIIFRPSGIILDYTEKCSHDDLIFTINQYKSLNDDDFNTSNSMYENELLLDNSEKKAKDYFKVKNKTDNYIYCDLYGITYDEKETLIGHGTIRSKSTTEVKTYYDGKLKELKAIKFLSDYIIEDYEISFDSHDLNLIIYTCEKPKVTTPEPTLVPEVSYKTEKDYPKNDILVTIQGLYKILGSDCYFDSFGIYIKNNSDKIIKIKFDESSISYDGSTSVPAIDGQKYVDVGKIPPNKILPKNISTEFRMYSSKQVSYAYNEWQVSTMGKEVTLVLAIEIDSKTYYWITEATIEQ